MTTKLHFFNKYDYNRNNFNFVSYTTKFPTMNLKSSLIVLLSLIFLNILAKDKKPFIPNCSDIHEGKVFMSHTEATNMMYHEYLYYQISRLSDNEYIALLPDTLVWRNKNQYNEPYVEYYFRHPAYREYPIVGLTKTQAQLFCDWLSKILTEENRKRDDSDVDSVLVRLPTQSEWIFAAQGGNEYYEYPWEGHDLRMGEGKFQGDMRANFVRGKGDYMGVAGSLNDHADITAPVKSYWPNDFGLYNCAGNIAEMVADKDVAMGGSWFSSGYDIRVRSEIPFTKPSSQVGFRYLVEVKKKKPVDKTTELKFNAKWVKQNFTVLGDTLHVQKFEVSNQLYNQFLREKNYPIQDTSLWNDLFPYSNYHTNNYRWHPDFENFPAVGMSRADAMAFCKWFKERLVPVLGDKIEVFIPYEIEWMEAARGGLDLSPYPWGGPYIFNSKGCALANFRYIPESFSSRNKEGEWQVNIPEGRHEMFGADFDGAMATTKVDAYHPNDYGIYNISGNVREMVGEKGMTKGGGWKSDMQLLQISAREEWNEKPTADIGFRVFVIVR